MNWWIRVRADAADRIDHDVAGMTAVHLGTSRFPATPGAVAEARRWLTDRLGRAHPARDDAVLLLSEAFTNSVRYSGGGEITVSVRAGQDGIHVDVIDQGGDTLPHYADDPYGEGGHGLPIMRALARDWGFDVIDRSRLLVWFEVGHPG